MPLYAGDVVSSYLRPDQRFVVMSVNRRSALVQCRPEDGGGESFWCSRSVLTRLESAERVPGNVSY